MVILTNHQISYSQNTFLQVKLNDGYHQTVEAGDIYLNQINESGFNQIINNQGGYIQPIQMSYKFSDELFNEFIGVRPIPSMLSNTTNLYNELLVSTTAVNSIFYNTTTANFPGSLYGDAADRLKIFFLNSTNVSYIATVNNIVETNNSQLNTIFQNFNVNKYENMFIRCDCNINELKTALLSLTNIISTVHNIVFTGIYLDNKEFITTKSVIYPNPFDDNITIETNYKIINYFISDINGKKIIEASSKNELEIKLKELSSGTYFLDLFFEDGQKESRKILKK